MTQRDAGLRVLLLDDHAVVREGLRLLLEQSIHAEVTEAAGLAEAKELDVDPEIVVADLILRDARGPTVVSQLSARFPNAGILVLSMLDGPEDVHQSLAAGARGYLLKEAAADELVEAVQRLAGGGEYVQPSLGAATARALESHQGAEPAAGLSLSTRETEILRLIALGHTNTEIASLLRIALRTVETHRSHILQKLGLRTRAELVGHAISTGLLDEEPK